MDDKIIIEKLSEKLASGNLDFTMENIAKICIDALKNGNEDDKNRARAMVKPFFVPFKTPSKDENREADKSKDISETIERAMIYAKEIRHYLDTKDLTPDLATCLEFTLERLTKEGATYEELAAASTLYEGKYKKAVEASSELINQKITGYGK